MRTSRYLSPLFLVASLALTACGGGEDGSNTTGVSDGGTTPPSNATASGYTMSAPSYFLGAAGASGSASQGYSVELDPATSSPGRMGIIILANTGTTDQALAFASTTGLFPYVYGSWGGVHGAYGGDLLTSLGLTASFFAGLGAQPCGNTLAAGASCAMAFVDGDATNFDATFTIDGKTVTVHVSAPVGTPGAPPVVALAAGGASANSQVLSQSDSDALKAGMPIMLGVDPATAQLDLGAVDASDPAAQTVTWGNGLLSLTNAGATSIRNLTTDFPIGDTFSSVPQRNSLGCVGQISSGASAVCALSLPSDVPGTYAIPMYSYDTYSTNPAYPSGGTVGVTTVKWTVQPLPHFKPALAVTYAGAAGSSTGTVTVTNNGAAPVAFGGAHYMMYRNATSQSTVDTSDCDNQPGYALAAGASCHIVLVGVVPGTFYNVGMLLNSQEVNPSPVGTSATTFYYYGSVSGVAP